MIVDSVAATHDNNASVPMQPQRYGGGVETDLSVLSGIEAAAAGLPAVRVSIRVSTDEGADGALAVAARTARSFVDGFSYLTEFVG